jgi:EAL domain-containing protein (putative c-di-GMP-specific phosphodiesterase class I)
MQLNNALSRGEEPQTKASDSLCFIFEKDFLIRQGLAAELRRTGISVVEFSTTTSLAEMVEEQKPDIVFVGVERTIPHDCVRTLLALRDGGFSGAVQLFGSSDQRVLQSLNVVGADCGLSMREPLQKPVRAATLHQIITGLKLGSAETKAGGIPLAEALARDLITFLYQPKFDLKTKGLIVGAEAVARVNHPKLGVLSPDRFLKGADQEDLFALANQALVDAAKSSLHFYELGLPIPISVNISIENLLSLPVCDVIARYRPESDGWGGVLLEIPSRLFSSKSDTLIPLFKRLKEAQVAVAIDNFGVGTIRIDMLKWINCSEIKIDRSLVDGCASDNDKKKICKSIIQVAHNFESRAVAVGVDNEADLNALSELECDYAQGFFLGKPMTLAAINSFIAKSKLGKEQVTSR